MDRFGGDESRNLGDYFDVFRRQWWVVGLFTLAGLVNGYTLLTVLPKSYTSSASVLVKPTQDQSVSSDSRTIDTVNLDTEAKLATSSAVAEVVRSQLSTTESVEKLVDRVAVVVPPNTTVLVISFEGTTPKEAQAGAEAFAAAYLEKRASTTEASLKVQIDNLRNQADSLGTSIDEVIAALPALPRGSSEYLKARDQLRSLNVQLGLVNERLLPLQASAVTPGEVIGEPKRPTHATSPNAALILPSAAMLGLLVGAAVAAWRRRRDGRLRHAATIESQFGLEVLGTISNSRLSAAQGSQVLQEYRGIVHAVQSRAMTGTRSILVAGVGSGSCAPAVAASLSTVIVRLGTSVSYVTSKQLSQSVDAEASEWIEVHSDGPVLTLTTFEQIGIMLEGNFQMPRISQAVQRLRERGEFVVLATHPTGASADAQAISPHVSLTVLVIELRRTTREDLNAALRQLQQVETPNVCAVILDEGVRRSKEMSTFPVGPPSATSANARAPKGPATSPDQQSGNADPVRGWQESGSSQPSATVDDENGHVAVGHK